MGFTSFLFIQHCPSHDVVFIMFTDDEEKREALDKFNDWDIKWQTSWQISHIPSHSLHF